MTKSVNQLQSLNRLAAKLSSATEIEEIIKAIIKEATELTEARRGSILLTKEHLETRFTTLIRVGTDRHQALLQKMSMMIAGWILKHKDSLLVKDIADDQRFKGLEMLGYPRQSVLAVPIQARAKILGVLVLNNDERDTPFDEDDLQLASIIASQSAHVLENAELLLQLKKENEHLREEIQRKYSFDEIMGRSKAMNRIFKLLEKIIPTDARVMIQGESGTGKELIARAVHYHGPRQGKRFVAVDCGALPENLLESELFGHVRGAFTGATESKKGLFQVADGGTLFLDEVNNTTPALQAKLLRAIQEGEIRAVGSTKTVKVDVRIICASSRDLAESVKAGTFREDLYFRLKVVPLKLPPLRERLEDISILAEHFLKKFSEALDKPLKGFSKESLQLLLQYDWPGNVRELENAIERCVTLAEPGESLIEPELLPDELQPDSKTGMTFSAPEGSTLLTAVETLERAMVSDALARFSGNRTRAAAHLGLSRRGLLNKIERYELEA